MKQTIHVAFKSMQIYRTEFIIIDNGKGSMFPEKRCPASLMDPWIWMMGGHMIIIVLVTSNGTI